MSKPSDFPLPASNGSFGYWSELALPQQDQGQAVFTCDVCAADVPYGNYDDATCPKCRSLYSYDEGYQIILSEEQCEILRKAALGN